MTQTEAELLLAELAERYGSQPYDPECDVTVRQVAERLGKADQAARDMLNRLVKMGIMVCRDVTMNGRRIKVYRRT